MECVGCESTIWCSILSCRRPHRHALHCVFSPQKLCGAELLLEAPRFMIFMATGIIRIVSEVGILHVGHGRLLSVILCLMFQAHLQSKVAIFPWKCPMSQREGNGIAVSP